jgi:hypothetical protein
VCYFPYNTNTQLRKLLAKIKDRVWNWAIHVEARDGRIFGKKRRGWRAKHKRISKGGNLTKNKARW